MNTATLLPRSFLALTLAAFLAALGGCTGNPGPRPTFIVASTSTVKALTAAASQYNPTLVVTVPLDAVTPARGQKSEKHFQIPASGQPDSNPGPRPVVLINLTSNPGPRPNLVICSGPTTDPCVPSGGDKSRANDPPAIVLEFPKRYPFHDKGEPPVYYTVGQPPPLEPAGSGNPGPRPR